jgi:hypothetical protein
LPSVRENVALRHAEIIGGLISQIDARGQAPIRRLTILRRPQLLPLGPRLYNCILAEYGASHDQRGLLNAAKIFLGIPLGFYASLSVLEPQKSIWRKPEKKVLIAFVAAWGAAFCLVAALLAWNASR